MIELAVVMMGLTVALVGTSLIPKESTTTRARSLVSSMFQSKIIVGILLLPFFKSSFYDAFGLLPLISNYMLVGESVLFLCLLFVCRYRSKILFGLCAYFIWTSGFAPILGGNPSPGTYYMCEGLGFTMLMMLGIKSSGRDFLNALSGWFCFACIANLLIMFAYPAGVSHSNDGAVWLFGIRTGFSLALIPAICFSCLYDCSCGRGVFSLRTWATVVVAVVSLIYQWVATGLVELLVLLALYIFAIVANRLPVRAIVIVVAVIGSAIVTLGPSTFVGGFVDMLGRDMTFTGRTEIWEVALNEISARPLFGFGGISYVVVYGTMKAFHSLWLSVAHESGLLGLLIYCVPFIMATKLFHEQNSKPPAQICAMAFIAIVIASFVEIQTYFPFIYGVLVLSELVKDEFEVFGHSSIPVPMALR